MNEGSNNNFCLVNKNHVFIHLLDFLEVFEWMKPIFGMLGWCRLGIWSQIMLSVRKRWKCVFIFLWVFSYEILCVCGQGIDEFMGGVLNELAKKKCIMQRFLMWGVKNTFSCVLEGLGIFYDWFEWMTLLEMHSRIRGYAGIWVWAILDGNVFSSFFGLLG